MGAYLKSEDLVKEIEIAQGRELESSERDEIDLWRKGRDIATLVTHPGWETILEILQQYSLKSFQQLMEVNPGDNKRVVAAQAVAYALHHQFLNFQNDIANCISASRSTPEVMKTALRNKTAMPIESVY